MSTTNNTPTGQDYLAIAALTSLTALTAYADSLERQAVNPDQVQANLQDLYDTGDMPYSYETEDQPEPNEKQIEKFERDIQKESPCQPEKIPSIIETALVSDLEFVKVSETISHKVALWEVRFTYDGKPCVGIISGCVKRPALDHDDLIQECKLDF